MEKTVINYYEKAHNALVAAVDKKGRHADECLKRAEGVAKLLEDADAKAVAVLFCAFDSGLIDISAIKTEYSDKIYDAVKAIGKSKRERYEEYDTRLKSNRLALIVKIADATYNSQASNFDESESAAIRSEKYRKHAEALTEWLEAISDKAAELLKLLSQNYQKYTPYSFNLFSANPPYLRFFSGLDEIILPLPGLHLSQIAPLLAELQSRGYLKYSISMYYSIELTKYGAEYYKA